VEPARLERTVETLQKIHLRELHRFRIGLNGLPDRPIRRSDGVVAVVSAKDEQALAEGFFRDQLQVASAAGAGGVVIFVGTGERKKSEHAASSLPARVAVDLIVPDTGFLLDGVTRAGLKMTLNALSTCIMVRLGRVMGNFMIYVVPSNLKLIDRATRYIEKLSGLNYVEANRLLFEVVEYVEPRMRADRAYPPVVGVAVLRAARGMSNEEAEAALAARPDSPA
jgi:N-acetylmuramic acid 6-phosphate (MurNAc-6-P) etherase